MCFGTGGRAAVQEANARIRGGVRLVPIRNTPESLKRMAAFNPGTYMMVVKKGAAVGVVEDVPVQSEDICIVVAAQLPDEVVHAVLNVLWENNAELRKVTPRCNSGIGSGWFPPTPPFPFTPGRSSFRDKGIWSPNMEKLQRELKNAKVEAAWTGRRSSGVCAASGRYRFSCAPSGERCLLPSRCPFIFGLVILRQQYLAFLLCSPSRRCLSVGGATR
jgi:hypothetical protein